MENTAINRATIAMMAIDGMTHEELRKALATELCKSYRNETGWFDTAVQVLKDSETIDQLLDKNDGDAMQVVIDDLWEYINSEKRKLWLESVREVK